MILLRQIDTRLIIVQWMLNLAYLLCMEPNDSIICQYEKKNK